MLDIDSDDSAKRKDEIDEDKLEYKLEKSVQMLISREDNRKKNASSKADPQTLASRVQSLDQGLHDLSEAEYMKRFGFEAAEVVRFLDKFELVVQFKGLYSFALVTATLQTSRDVLALSLYQWQRALDGYGKWLGNFVQEVGEEFTQFCRVLTPMGEHYTKESLMRVQ